MTGRVLAGIALRVWGVVFLVGALAQLPQLATILGQPASDANAAMRHAQTIAIVLSLVVRAGLGIALVALGDRVARAVVPDTQSIAIDADPSELAAIAFAVTGIVILVWGLMEAGVVAYTAVTKPSWPAEPLPAYVWGQRRETVVRAIVEVAAGVVLILGRDGLSRAWQAVRGRTSQDAGDAQ